MNDKEFEEMVIKFLEKKGVSRFSEFMNWLDTATINTISKSTVSKKLDKLADEGKIFSWHEKKGERYISLPCNMQEIKHSVMKKINDLWLKKEKVTFDEIQNNMPYPPNLIKNAIDSYVAEGKILNTTIDNITYYTLPPLHHSIKVGIILSIIITIIYIVGKNVISKYHIFTALLIIIALMTVLWYKMR